MFRVILSNGNAEGKVGQRLKERPSRDLQTPTWTLLLLLICACKQESDMPVLWEALPTPDWDRCRYSQLTIELNLEIPMEDVGEGLKGLKGIVIRDRTTISINQTPQGTHGPNHQPLNIHVLVPYKCSRELPHLTSVEGKQLVLSSLMSQRRANLEGWGKNDWGCWGRTLLETKRKSMWWWGL